MKKSFSLFKCRFFKVPAMVYRPRSKAKIAKRTKRCAKCGALIGRQSRCRRCHKRQ